MRDNRDEMRDKKEMRNNRDDNKKGIYKKADNKKKRKT